MWHTNENKWVCSVNPTANNGHFNRRTGENREGHYSGHLVLMWTKTWSTSITCLIICTMVINTTQKKLKIPWCHVSFPHTKGHVLWPFHIDRNLYRAAQVNAWDLGEIYLHEELTVYSACHSNSMTFFKKKIQNILVHWKGILSRTMCCKQSI